MRTLFILLGIYFLPVVKPTLNKEKINHVKAFAIQQHCRTDYAIFIDMSLPSDQKRWYLVNLSTMNIVYSTYVAHGKGSGEGKTAQRFSDIPGSNCTALGIYKITGSYNGKHGLSYTLDGLEASDKNALSRSIVIHSAWYADDSFIAKYDRCGSSWGCPAVSATALKTCEPYLKPGTLVWIYTD